MQLIERFRLGFALNGSAMASLLYGIESVTRDKSWWFALSFCAAGIMLGLAAIRHARRHANPLLPLVPFDIKSFSVAMLWGGGLFRLGVAGFSFLIPLMLQVAFGIDPLASGLIALSSVNSGRQLPAQRG